MAHSDATLPRDVRPYHVQDLLFGTTVVYDWRQ